MTRYEKQLLSEILSRVAHLSRNNHIFGILHMPPGGPHAYYGHEFMEQTLRPHENTFLRHADFHPEATSAAPPRLPFDLCRTDICILRSHCSKLVRYGFAKLGRSKPKYKGEPRPSFWPENKPWGNPSSGISKDDLMFVIDHLHTYFDSDATATGNPPPSPPRQVTPAPLPSLPSSSPGSPATSPSLPSSSPGPVRRQRRFITPVSDSSSSSNEHTVRPTRRRNNRMSSGSSTLDQSPGTSTRSNNIDISLTNNDFSPIPSTSGPICPSLVKRKPIARRPLSAHQRHLNEHPRDHHSVSPALQRYRHPEQQRASNMNCIETNESSSIQVRSTPNVHPSTVTSAASDVPVPVWHTPQISSNIDPRTRDIAIRSRKKSKRGRLQKKKNKYTPSDY